MQKKSGEGETRQLPDAFEVYRRKMKSFPLLEPAVAVGLFQQMEAGKEAKAQLASSPGHPEKAKLEEQVALAEDARRRLIESNLRLVPWRALKYRNPYPNLDFFMELLAEGVLGLILAVDAFNWRKGYRFSTYAKKCINRSMWVFLSQNMVGRVPQYLVGRIIKYRHVKNILMSKTQEEPSIGQLAAAMRMSVVKVTAVKAAINNRPKVISLQETSEAGNLPEVENCIPRADRMEQVLGLLNPRERLILQLRFNGEDGKGMTLEQVGKRLGLTKERIRQIEAAALGQLEVILTSQGVWGSGTALE
ncbi:sigma-70 family RNA polymerase sigma factor [Candidatus Parcubacteria bacterium]|nr:sigma-70 family RNA polymerase sigma factor [Candidatus Parcubacteria bacterium]